MLYFAEDGGTVQVCVTLEVGTRNVEIFLVLQILADGMFFYLGNFSTYTTTSVSLLQYSPANNNFIAVIISYVAMHISLLHYIVP